MRPGLLTTEFWVTAAILGLAAAFGLPESAGWKLRLGVFFGAVASGVTYKWARTSQKNKAARARLTIPGPKGLATLRLLACLAAAAAILGACALGSAEGRKRLAGDLVACGISVGLTELRTLTDHAGKTLEDGRVSDGEVQAALDALASAAKPGLAACVVALIHDAINLPPAPASTSEVAVAALVYESPKARAKRRASLWLEKTR